MARTRDHAERDDERDDERRPHQEIVIIKTVYERTVSEHYYRLPDGTLLPVMPAGMQVISSPARDAPRRGTLMGGAAPQRQRQTALLGLGDEAPREPLDRRQVRAAMILVAWCVFGLIVLAVLVQVAWRLRSATPPGAAATDALAAAPGAAPEAAPAAPAPEAAAPLGTIVGVPSISAATIDAVLASYDSPAAGSGQAFYDLGVQYGIDPAYALAFFIHESTAGTAAGWAGRKPDGSTTHNVGNIICAGYATCVGGFRDYPSWEKGVEDWYRLIRDEYVQGRGLSTLEQILPVYCPVNDGCDPAGYAQIVRSQVASWRSTGAAAAGAAAAPTAAATPSDPPAAAPAPTWLEQLRAALAASFARPSTLTASPPPPEWRGVENDTWRLSIASVTVDGQDTVVSGALINKSATPQPIDPRNDLLLRDDQTGQLYGPTDGSPVSLAPGARASIDLRIPLPTANPLTIRIQTAGHPPLELKVRP